MRLFPEMFTIQDLIQKFKMPKPVDKIIIGKGKVILLLNGQIDYVNIPDKLLIPFPMAQAAFDWVQGIDDLSAELDIFNAKSGRWMINHEGKWIDSMNGGRLGRCLIFGDSSPYIFQA